MQLIGRRNRYFESARNRLGFLPERALFFLLPVCFYVRTYSLSLWLHVIACGYFVVFLSSHSAARSGYYVNAKNYCYYA